MTVPAETNERYGRIIESARLADAVIAPSTVDSNLSDLAPSLMPKPQNTRKTLAVAAQPILARHGMLAGFATFGAACDRTDCPPPGWTRSLRVTLLSMRDAAAAQTAAREIETADFAMSDDNVPVSLAGHPTALSHWRPTVPTLGVVVARRSFIIALFIRYPTPDLDAMTRLATATLDAQFDLADRFVPTREDLLDELPLDQDGLLSRMVPTERGSWPYPSISGTTSPAVEAGEGLVFRGSGVVYGPGGARLVLVSTGKPIPSPELMAVVDRRWLLRMPDPEAARTMMRGYTMLAISDSPTTPVAPPPDVPESFCHRYEEMVPMYVCFLTAGRYFATVKGHDMKSAHQMAAAQYTLMAALEPMSEVPWRR
ncbi:hypothetical protein ACFXK0_24375 [Nocardia sp. NPDC059177]|uniref:DUF7373 family lipoprotein n=1 Tax=Nocardia sp. NPDC059177 TaxID=3346759 RepID=UPI0036A7153F